MSILLDNIKKESSKRGYSLRKLNDLAGLKPNIIYSWAKQEPSLTSLQKVADVLHVSTDYLLGRTDEMNPSTTETVKKADIDDSDLLLAFDGKDIDEEDKQAIIDLLMFRRYQKRNEGK